MAEFADVRSGFDLELILENKFLKHLIALFNDSEPEVYLGSTNLLKNYSGITREYDAPNGVETEGPIIEIRDFQGSNYFYVLLNVLSNLLEINGLKCRIVIRINRKQPLNLLNILSHVGLTNSKRIYNHFKNIVRIEGLILDYTNNRYNIPNDETQFTSDLAQKTALAYDTLSTILGEAKVLSHIFGPGAQKLFRHFVNVDNEKFLMGLNNAVIGNPLFVELKQLITDTEKNNEGISFTSLFNRMFIPQKIYFKGFPGRKAIGIYGNLNTISPNLAHKTDKGRCFADERHGGVAINVTEQLITGILFKSIQNQMYKLLDDGNATTSQVNSVRYRLPFVIPKILLEEEADKKLPGSIEIDKINYKRVHHKFKSLDKKIEAMSIKFIVSPKSKKLLNKAFNFLHANPTIEIIAGLQSTGEGYEHNTSIYLDLNLNIPYPLYVIIVAPILHLFNSMLFPTLLGIPPMPGLFAPGLGSLPYHLTVFGTNEVKKKVIRDIASNQEKVENIAEQLSNIRLNKIVQKRWDPFYYTNHSLDIFPSTFQINHLGQIKANLDYGLSRQFEPYKGVYIKAFDIDQLNLSSVTFRLSNISNVLHENLPGTSRETRLYGSLDRLSNEITLSTRTRMINLFKDQAASGKLIQHIPYIPYLIRKSSSGRIELVYLLSELRQAQLISIFKENYINAEIDSRQEELDEIFRKIIPSFNPDKISPAHRRKARNELRKIIISERRYNRYKSMGVYIEIRKYLRNNPNEALALSIQQIVFLGLKRRPERVTLDSIFDFIHLPGYLAIGSGSVTGISLENTERNRFNISDLVEF